MLMSAALNLAFAIDHHTKTMDLRTNLIGIAQQNLPFEQGVAVMSVKAQMYEALERVIEKGQYLREKDFEKILEFYGYARNFDWWVSYLASCVLKEESESFCKLAKSREEEMFAKLTELKELLGKYIPRWAQTPPPRPAQDNIFVDD
jgi:hypothetical protein